ncbi:M3 family metallopeptidase [Streptomyces sp. NPDC002680]|uniref:M3 family metallopeptidase n=1 Tax=Streptomyces sp. NPDC002680 TaxID=3364659 RepID=UPI003681BD14
MSVDLPVAPDYESLDQTDAALDAMMTRLRALLDLDALSEDAFVEICAIYNNVAYIFLYLESNEAHVNYERLLPWRDAFHRDAGIDAALLDRLLTLRCIHTETEEARTAYVAHLRAKPAAAPERTNDGSHEQLLVEAKDILDEIRHDGAMLLQRIGSTSRANPNATFYKLVGSTNSAATRTKLGRVWRATRDRRLGELTSVVDRMVDARRRESRAQGADSVLAITLRRCRVSEEAAWRLVERYLISSLEHQERLDSEVLAATGAPDNAMDHFGHFVRALQAGRGVPLFPVEGCLSFIRQVAKRLFGLTLTEAPTRSNPHVLAFDVELDGRLIGHVNLDLWETDSQRRTANTTKGIRNRTEWHGIVQRPVAYVSCRFRRTEDGANRITFQNVHSLFHEFGHAVNHLLIRKRLPTQSGLEYLPLERLEDLSMWFEKWVYHRQFADHLNLSPTELDGLQLCQDVKRLEYRRSHVDRAVTAALDFELHRKSDGGIEGAFQRLDEQYGIGAHCTLGDFPPYFTWPMFRANPGANFAYLWGASTSAQLFAPFLDTAIEDAGEPADLCETFLPCFDFDQPSVEPDSAAIFSFYEGQPRSGAEGTVAGKGKGE